VGILQLPVRFGGGFVGSEGLRRPVERVVEGARQKGQGFRLSGEIFRHPGLFIRRLQQLDRPSVGVRRAGVVAELLQGDARAHERMSLVAGVAHLPAAVGGSPEVL
jgi:hypothetical protein